MHPTNFEVQSHHFIAGIYLKQVLIPDGHEIVSHKHLYPHASIIASGCVIVETDDGIQNVYFGPDVIEIKAGVTHKVLAVNGPAVWYCIHKTDCTDAELVDAVLIEKADA